MARALAKLGAWSYRRRGVVVAAWVVAVLAMAVASGALKAPTNEEFNVPGTQAQDALELLERKIPGAGGATARIVFAAPPGHTIVEPRYRAVITPTLERVARVPQSLGNSKIFAASFQVAPDHDAAFADLPFVVSVGKLKSSTKAALVRVTEPARKAGLLVGISGGVTSTAASKNQATEAIGIAIAFVVLLVAFGTVSIAVLPLITAIVGVAVGLLAINAATGLTQLNSTAPTLASMIGLAVGIDYATFITSRHRQQVLDGMRPEESIAIAVGTAGGAVCFAGATVVLALLGMLVIGIPFLSVMGLAAAGTVVIAVAVALTLLPALLGFAGRHAAGGRHPPRENPFGARWAAAVLRRPVLTIVGVVVIVAVLAIPATSLHLALPDAATKPKNTLEHRAYELLGRYFGPGYESPLLVIGDASGSANPAASLKAARAALGTFPDVAAISAPEFNSAHNFAVVSVTPRSGPDSEQTKALVRLVRTRAAAAASKYGIRGYVTGRTATDIDTSEKISSGLPTFIVLIVVLALLLQTWLFRSIAVPIKAVVGFLFTIAASLGVATWVFQEGHLISILGVEATAPVVSFLPVLLVAILFGLAMDYEVFLVTRIRETYVKDPDPRQAIVGGFRVSARVVTAAALIMISVFSSFVTGNEVVVKSIAFVLAFGVLIDAFLVRMTLVPAVLALLGRHAWTLPGWLDRLLPKLDIEGEDLAPGEPLPAGAPEAAAG